MSAVDAWAIVLNPEQRLKPEAYQRLDMLITDPDHPALTVSQETGIMLFAYLSIGEAESYRVYWKEIQNEPWVLEENPYWKENYMVDMRSEKWHDLLLDRVIPEITAKGYRGLFLDTIDTASALYAGDPDKYSGILEAPGEIIRKIRKRYPDLMLIPNNGLDLFDSFGSVVDAVFAEDLYGMPDFENGGYIRTDQADSDEKVSLLRAIRKKYGLPVFIVDYADENNRKTVLNLIKMNKKNKFKPYIAEKELLRIYKQDSI